MVNPTFVDNLEMTYIPCVYMCTVQCQVNITQISVQDLVFPNIPAIVMLLSHSSNIFLHIYKHSQSPSLCNQCHFVWKTIFTEWRAHPRGLLWVSWSLPLARSKRTLSEDYVICRPCSFIRSKRSQLYSKITSTFDWFGTFIYL